MNTKHGLSVKPKRTKIGNCGNIALKTDGGSMDGKYDQCILVIVGENLNMMETINRRRWKIK